MTKEMKEIEKRFVELRNYAIMGHKFLPVEFDGDIVDAKYFELFMARKFNSDRGRYSPSDDDEFKKIYLAKYCNDKRDYKLNWEIAKKHLEFKRKNSTILCNLQKENMPYTTYGSMVKVFQLLGVAMNDEHSAKLLKEKLIPLWLTGCGNLTKEERLEVMENVTKRIFKDEEEADEQQLHTD